MATPAQEKASQWEQLFRTIMTAILVAVMLWVGNNTQQSAIALVSIQKDIEHVVERVNQHDDRLKNLSSRVRSLENQR